MRAARYRDSDGARARAWGRATTAVYGAASPRRARGGVDLGKDSCRRSRTTATPAGRAAALHELCAVSNRHLMLMREAHVAGLRHRGSAAARAFLGGRAGQHPRSPELANGAGGLGIERRTRLMPVSWRGGTRRNNFQNGGAGLDIA